MTDYYPKRNLMINEAKDLINGDRQAEYGPPHKNFSDIAQGWSVIFDRKIYPF